jgi:hypothetical protein
LMSTLSWPRLLAGSASSSQMRPTCMNSALVLLA